jgi:Ala-tRNA(Pro) deacylase
MSISTGLKSFLDKNHVSYSAVPHTTTYTAQGTAAMMKVSGKEMAKTVVLKAGEDTILGVLPAAHHASLEKLSTLIGKPVRLATELEFASLFPDCELGAMPPFGSLYHLPVYVDSTLAEDEEIVFNAGTHHDAIRMRYLDFQLLAQPTICSFAGKS